MKIGISLLGYMISLLASGMKGEDGTCSRMSDPEYFDCRMGTGAGLLFVIPKSVPNTAKSIKLNKDDGNKSWLINNINYFSRYPALLEIIIFGPVKIHQSLLEPSAKIELQNKLFDLPKLKLIQCQNCLFDSNNHMWKLPRQIERLILNDNLYDSFQVSYSPYLFELNLENNNLTKMPQWFENKSSPMQTLCLYNNPRLEINFNDLAKLCFLKVITLDVSNKFITSKSQACDCFRIMKWTKDLDVEISSPDGQALSCYKTANCDKNKSEEYRVKKEFCHDKRQRKTQNGLKPAFKASQELLTAVFIIIFILFCMFVSGIVMYTRIASRRKRRRKYRKRGDGSFPDIGAYF